MIGSRKRSIGYAVTIDVAVALEASKFFQIFCAEDLASIELFLRIRKRIRHPIIHAQIQIAHHEDWRLESFGEIKCLVPHVKAFGNAGWQQHDMLRVPMGRENHGKNVGLLRSRRQSSAWTDARNIENNGGNLGVVSESDKLLHQRDSRTRS